MLRYLKCERASSVTEIILLLSAIVPRWIMQKRRCVELEIE